MPPWRPQAELAGTTGSCLDNAKVEMRGWEKKTCAGRFFAILGRKRRKIGLRAYIHKKERRNNNRTRTRSERWHKKARQGRRALLLPSGEPEGTVDIANGCSWCNHTEQGEGSSAPPYAGGSRMIMLDIERIRALSIHEERAA